MPAGIVCIYEDELYDSFYPMTLLRPVYLLRAGILAGHRKARLRFPGSASALVCRKSLAGLVSEMVRDVPVNIVKRSEAGVLFLNGRIRRYGDLPNLVGQTTQTTRFVAGDKTVAVLFGRDTLERIPPVADPEIYLARLQEVGETVSVVTTSADMYTALWDFVSDIETAIAEDFAMIGGEIASGARLEQGAWFVNEEKIGIGDMCEIGPGALLDASEGPILVGPNTKVQSQAAIYGPAFIGPNSLVLAGRITASSIGHTCRVGGEVEESIFQSYVNKYHAGFIGHSYVGSWVNFGAMTTNSDLKNNYSSIRVTRRGEVIDTGLMKVGSFIGDHTKFGIGSLLNTGITVGACCNVFGGTLVTDKEVNSFSWGGSGRWEKHDLQKALTTARRTCRRRSVDLSTAEEQMLRTVSEGRSEQQGLFTVD